MNEQLLKEIKETIEAAIYHFENDYGKRVTLNARLKLESPVYEHPFEIGERIKNGTYSVFDIGKAIQLILKNAHENFPGEDYSTIDVLSVERSMHFYCPILFWC